VRVSLCLPTDWKYSSLHHQFYEAVGDFGVGFIYIMTECPACNTIRLLRHMLKLAVNRV